MDSFMKMLETVERLTDMIVDTSDTISNINKTLVIQNRTIEMLMKQNIELSKRMEALEQGKIRMN